MQKIMTIFGLLLAVNVFATELEGFETDYTDLMLAKAAGEKVFVAFTATWCGPCNKFKKEVLTTSRFLDLADELGFRKFNIDVDENPGTLNSWGGAGIPNWFLVKDDSVVYNHAGYSTSKIEEVYETISDAFLDDIN
jgi:thiol-disulfide isomerase/thioredoxin